MTALLPLALVLLAITGRTELLNETIQIPRSQWRSFKVEVRERPATVEVDFKVLSGRSGVRVVFMTNENAERFEKRESYEVLDQTGYEGQGTFQYLVAIAGEYRILLDNRLEGREPAEAQVKVALLYHEYSSFEPKMLAPGKRLAVTRMSVGGFLIVALVIGRKLWPALRGRGDS
jgi:hypothetical protein